MGGSVSSEFFDYDAQLASDKSVRSVEVGEATPGESKVRRHPVGAEKLYTAALPNENDGKGYATLWEVFQRGVKKFPEASMLGTRKWEHDEKGQVVKDKDGEKRGEYLWETYAEVDRQVRDFGAGLVALGYGQHTDVGIFGNNRAEWVVGLLGLFSQNMRVVPLYATLGEDAIFYVCDHAALKVVLVSKENLPGLMKAMPRLKLEVVVQFDVDARWGNVSETISQEHLEQCEKNGVRLIGFNEVKKMGAEKTDIFPTLPVAEDLAYIMYTSGTTGNPKGVLLPHRALVATVAAGAVYVDIGPTDRHLSYLPLAHIFESFVQFALFLQGAGVGFYQGNIKKMTEDIQSLQPTVLCGVPRVFSRIYQRVMDGVKNRKCIERLYIQRALTGQTKQVRYNLPRHEAYDKKVFIPLREKLGLEKCRYVITGAAPCPPFLLEFLKVVIGASVLQGYGMTEGAACGAISAPDDQNVGHVGAPTPACEIKLVDIPDMGYTTDSLPQRGEIWVRGPNVFTGYYKDEQNTVDTLTEDGWLKTGDVGRWNPNGTLSIIDRKKNMFKLSQGEYIAAEKVEAEYQKSSACGQVWVYGNSFKSFLLAVLVPAPDFVYNLSQEKGWWPRPASEVKMGDAQFIADFKTVMTGAHADALRAEIIASLKSFEKGLKGFEKVTDFLLENDIDAGFQGFTEANDLLTPTFKLKRNKLLARYITQLKALYTKHGEAPSADEKWPGEN